MRRSMYPADRTQESRGSEKSSEQARRPFWVRYNGHICHSTGSLVYSGKPACLAQGREIVSWLTSGDAVGLYPFGNVSRDSQPNCRVRARTVETERASKEVQWFQSMLIRGLLVLPNHTRWQSLFLYFFLPFSAVIILDLDPCHSIWVTIDGSLVAVRRRSYGVNCLCYKFSNTPVWGGSFRYDHHEQDYWNPNLPFRTSRDSVERFILMLVGMGVHDAGTASPLPLEATLEPVQEKKILNNSTPWRAIRYIYLLQSFSSDCVPRICIKFFFLSFFFLFASVSSMQRSRII